MKRCRILAALAVAALLTACGHGYEGEYDTATEANSALMKSVVQLVGQERIVIGDDYIETNGQRRTYDDIFVRKSGSARYLVFKRGDVEEVWEIVDDRTLRQGSGLLSVTLTRVD